MPIKKIFSLQLENGKLKNISEASSIIGELAIKIRWSAIEDRKHAYDKRYDARQSGQITQLIGARRENEENSLPSPITGYFYFARYLAAVDACRRNFTRTIRSALAKKTRREKESARRRRRRRRRRWRMGNIGREEAGSRQKTDDAHN